MDAASVSMENEPNGALTCFHAAPSASSEPWLSFSAFGTALSVRISVTTRPSET